MSEQDLYPEPAAADEPATASVLELPRPAEPEPERPREPAAEAAKPRRSRPTWVVPAAIAAVGVVVASTLGGVLYVNTGQRDLARHQLAATSAELATTKASLATTQGQLSTAQDTIASQAIVDHYTTVVLTDGARLNTDQASMWVNCADKFNAAICLGDIQNDLNDAQAFQSDRSKATVPAQLSDADAQLKDALSAAIAADQEVLAGISGHNDSQIADGYYQVDTASLAVGKAEAAIAGALK